MQKSLLLALGSDIIKAIAFGEADDEGWWCENFWSLETLRRDKNSFLKYFYIIIIILKVNINYII